MARVVPGRNRDPTALLTTCTLPSWNELVEAAVFETDRNDLPQRIQDAQEAIMDEIEDSFQTASSSERQSLINAMNAMRELRRMSEIPGWKSEETNSRNTA